MPPGAYTPSQISSAYGFNQISFNNGTVKGDGTGQTIAIVDAYNAPNIKSDLTTFDSKFALAASPSFTVVNQTGGSKLPSADPTGGWELEEALDVEWAHAMAPGAKIILVEANSSSTSDLFAAVKYASANASVVSMSWGLNEFSGETGYDSYFTTPNVTFVAAAGDSGAPPIYPATSPNVLAVGGTTLPADSKGNALLSSETAWNSGGGGISQYEVQPSGLPTTYSNGATTGIADNSTSSGYMRMSPDVAYDADPNTGFAIYDSSTYYPYYPYSFGRQSGWFEIGGTSAGAPQWAALVAIADQGRQSASEPLLSGAGQTVQAIYNMNSGDFHDITSGTSNGSPNYTAGTGYDLVTGRGSPAANLVVQALVSASSTGGVNGLAVSSGGSTSPGSSAVRAQALEKGTESDSTFSPSSASSAPALLGPATGLSSTPTPASLLPSTGISAESLAGLSTSVSASALSALAGPCRRPSASTLPAKRWPHRLPCRVGNS